MLCSRLSCFVLYLISLLAYTSRGYCYRSQDSKFPHKGRYQSQPLRSRASSYAITGIPDDGSGTIPQRLEIRKLEQNKAQWNLYLLALDELQKVDQSNLTSFFQIAGIHGEPFIEWDSVAFAPGRSGGYCTHASPLFPPWHRPFVALYEQVLYGIVQDIASRFTGSTKNDYVTAASTFRVPYWDWVAPPPPGGDTMPTSISSSAAVQVITPTGPSSIPNPLYQYHFNPSDSQKVLDYPFNQWQATLRYPTNKDDVHATSQMSKVVADLNIQQPLYAKRLLNLLAAYPTYEKFSNKAWLWNITNPGGSYDSLESLHTCIHSTIGQGGHMSFNEVSGFDPVFMLHHANTDRLFAIWQVKWPNSYMEPSTASSGTATITIGDSITQDSPLTPFHKDTSGTFWTSAAVRDTRTFGYVYSETADNNASSATYAVNRLYQSTAEVPDNGTVSSSTISGTVTLPAPTGTAIPAPYTGTATATLTPYDRTKRASTQNTRNYTEWITNVRVAQNAMNSNFDIFVFLGSFGNDVSKWRTDPHLAGTVTIFKPVGTAQQQQEDAGLVVAGAVPLTKKLNDNAAAGGYNVDDSASVAAYLKKNLHWQVATNTAIVPRNKIPSLKVSVVSCPVTEAASLYEFPVWGECTPHVGITDSQSTVGGLQAGDAV